MSLRRHRVGFTVVEIMIAVLILALMTYVSWNLLGAGMLQTANSSEHLSAVQNAMILMENIQEDVRQIAVLNDSDSNFTSPLQGYTILTSRNKKSIMFRKSAKTNRKGKAYAGAAFTVVIYQLVKRKDAANAYSVRRLERQADGSTAAGGQHVIDDKSFQSLVLKDMTWTVAEQWTGMTPPIPHLRVAITVVNTALKPGELPSAREPKYFFLANSYVIQNPKPLHKTLNNQVFGFAEKFIDRDATKYPLASGDIALGKGMITPLPPGVGSLTPGTGWPDWQNWPADDASNPSAATKGWDYADVDGSNKNFQNSLNSSFDSFDRNLTAPPCAKEVVLAAVGNFETLLGSQYEGDIDGNVDGPILVPGTPAPWSEPFKFTVGPTATETLAVQVDKFLTQHVIPHGAAGVAEMCHDFNAFSQAAQSQKPNPITAAGATMMTTAQCEIIVQGG